MASLNDNLIRLNNAHANIATAITEMGGTVNTNDGFEDFPADIRTISASTEEIIGTVSSYHSYLAVTTGSIKQLDRYVRIYVDLKNNLSSGRTISSGTSILGINGLQLENLTFNKVWFYNDSYESLSGSSYGFFYAATLRDKTNTGFTLAMNKSKTWYSGDTYTLGILIEFTHN